MRGKPQKDSPGSTMETNLDPHAQLMRTREAILLKLASLASDSIHANDLLDQFRETESMLAGRLPIHAGKKYGAHRSGAFALEAYLIERKKPVNEDQAIHDVLAGGFGIPWSKDPEKALKQSIGQIGKLTKRVVSIDGKLGLPRWVRRGAFDERLFGH